MKKVLIDVDTGIDDALALSYAVHSPELEILGVTTTFGNITVEEATRNTLQILELLGASQIPVFPGASRPLFRELKEKAKLFHGENGLGNIQLPPPRTAARREKASVYMIEQARLHPGEVMIITVGSLTNLATAIMAEPEMTKLVRRVIIMGGAVTVPGNRTPVAEANICADPEAAALVFRSGIPITVVGLDVTMQTLLTREHLETWRELGTDVSRSFAEMCQFYMDAYAKVGNVRGCGLHDPLAVGVAIDPSCVRTSPMYIAVDTSGGLSDARTIADRRSQPEFPPNADVCLEVDHAKFLAHFLQRVF